MPYSDGLTQYLTVVDLSSDPDGLTQYLTYLDSHCAQAIASGDPDPGRIWYGRTVADFVAALRRAIQQGNETAAAVAGINLGVLLRDWETKDRAEPDFLRGVKDRADKRNAAVEATKTREKKRESSKAAWQRSVRKLNSYFDDGFRTDRSKWIASRLGGPSERAVYKYLSKLEAKPRRK